MPVTVTNNRDTSRYELHVDEELVCIADYRVDGATIIFPHTETIPSHRGRGYAATLVRYALDEARQSGASVVPACWFVANFIRDNPSYADLLAA